MPDFFPPALKALYSGSNFKSVEMSLNAYGKSAGLDKPHRLAHYMAQIAHESGNFKFDREIWGPTPAQKRYDTRTDLGNTPAVDGDGKKYAGRTGIQITGKANVQAFRDWCLDQGLAVPDFVEHPELLNTDPWEGLAPIWFWTVGNPTGKSLNVLADANNIEQITKRINGGLNGYADRIAKYTEIALVLAGFREDDIKAFQARAKQIGVYDGEIDGDAGPKTRAALHLWLAGTTSSVVTAAPVVAEKEVAVAPAGGDKTGVQRVAALVGAASPALATFGGLDPLGKYVLVAVGLVAVGVLLWRGELIASRVRAVLASFEQ